MKVPLPIVIAREGKWWIASCPALDIGTQGKTEQEARKMISHLINEYLSDPDTRKPRLDSIMSVSLTTVLVQIPAGVLHGKAASIA
ncbi:type II toxin-antitoxin system HicB family antitoxin [Candidatus Micrarchaeota archaeon]|nr:type II toxin-antitoxin system HicB family antitoxin [Candidatus Micrarchaeota archaeon]